MEQEIEHMQINEYAVDLNGWWHKWYAPMHKYVALKKEFWPTQKKGEPDGKV